MKSLVVMRHSKAEQGGPTDFERELSERGRRDAGAVGEWLAAEGFTPDRALVSAAVRTVQTWEAVAGGARWTLEPDLDRGLYAADVDTAIDVVRALPDDCERAIVIGHNPTMASVAQVLDDGSGETEAANALLTGFPTSAVAVFEYDGDWTDLGPYAARLVGYYVGRS